MSDKFPSDPIWYQSVHRNDFEARFGHPVSDKEWQEVVQFLHQYSPSLTKVMGDAMRSVQLRRSQATVEKFGRSVHGSGDLR